MPAVVSPLPLSSLLTVDASLYLPPYKSVNIYFMKEIMTMK